MRDSGRHLLTIDTSSAQGSVALYDGRNVSFLSWHADRSHTTTLLAEIHHLLESAALGAHNLAAIGIATGPGAFTGLRAGFGVAKGFHLATGAPLIGISTLAATALPHAMGGNPIIATVGAGRGRLVWARYEASDNDVLETQAPRNGTVDELSSEIKSLQRVVIAGELDDEQAQTLSAFENALIPPPALRYRHPVAFAELAWQRLCSERFDDAARLEPVYLAR